MKKHVMIDIEALGLRPGAAITELGAVEFYPEEGWVGAKFEALILPMAPLTADLETLAWHKKQRTWPRTAELEAEAMILSAALSWFNEWFISLGKVEAVWAWGATYDFPLLTAAYDVAGFNPPWSYFHCRCARTVWQLAYGEKKHKVRPHLALEDAVCGAVDLMAAMGEME